MRLNRAAGAVHVLRGVTQDGGVFLRTSAPLVCKINLATALALSGNDSGCLNVLNEIPLESDPRIQALRSVLKNRESKLSFWEWILWRGGAGVDRPVELDAPAGFLI